MPMIMEVEDDGEVLVLDDGTRWRVQAEDIPTAILWLPSENVLVAGLDSGLHEIIRLNDAQSVLVSLIDDDESPPAA